MATALQDAFALQAEHRKVLIEDAATNGATGDDILQRCQVLDVRLDQLRAWTSVYRDRALAFEAIEEAEKFQQQAAELRTKCEELQRQAEAARRAEDFNTARKLFAERSKLEGEWRNMRHETARKRSAAQAVLNRTEHESFQKRLHSLNQRLQGVQKRIATAKDEVERYTRLIGELEDQYRELENSRFPQQQERRQGIPARIKAARKHCEMFARDAEEAAPGAEAISAEIARVEALRNSVWAFLPLDD